MSVNSNQVIIQALNQASSQSVSTRKGWTERGLEGEGGMKAALEGFQNSSKVGWTSRRFDGLVPIDEAVVELLLHLNGRGKPRYVKRLWAGDVPLQPYVENVLNACHTWLNTIATRRSRAATRGHAIREIREKLAWCYVVANYAVTAHGVLNDNNSTGNPTGCLDPSIGRRMIYSGFDLSGFDLSHPYQHIDYVAENLSNEIVLRGDSRAPKAIFKANGFQPRQISDREAYSERVGFWSGSAGGDEISICTAATRETCYAAIDAGHAAMGGTKGRFEDLPGWLKDRLDRDDTTLKELTDDYMLTDEQNENKRQNARVGLIYEVDLGDCLGIRMLTQVPGAEYIYLGIPRDCIKAWWLIWDDRRTLGPIPFSDDQGLYVGDDDPGLLWEWSEPNVLLDASGGVAGWAGRDIPLQTRRHGESISPPGSDIPLQTRRHGESI